MEKIREEKHRFSNGVRLSVKCPRCKEKHEIGLVKLTFPVILTDELYFNMFSICESVEEPIMAWYSDISKEVTILV